MDLHKFAEKAVRLVGRARYNTKAKAQDKARVRRPIHAQVNDVDDCTG
jgi:hypothetical protein